MTKKEIEKRLKKAGWTIQHGANHDKAISPDDTTKIPIPRHKGDIKKGLAISILKAAGLL
ncbi:MAG: type II toxin-antitoxin system HicA family toxin [Spirochaetia bacterium]|nr:type II toxin-antitoxin system HicA family toxin [Spirochaetia bacterium]